MISCRWDTGGDRHRRIMAKNMSRSYRRFSDFWHAWTRGGAGTVAREAIAEPRHSPCTNQQHEGVLYAVRARCGYWVISYTYPPIQQSSACVSKL